MSDHTMERTVPRFFFHIRDHLNLTDGEGFDFANKAAALQEAIKAAGQIIADEGSELREGETWTMSVSDHAGGLVCSLSFSAKFNVADEVPGLRIAPSVGV